MRETAKQLKERVRELEARLEKAENPEPDLNYDVVSNRIVEVSTPTSRTRFHDPNDRVELEREKYENARLERKVQSIRFVTPNARGMR